MDLQRLHFNLLPLKWKLTVCVFLVSTSDYHSDHCPGLCRSSDGSSKLWCNIVYLVVASYNERGQLPAWHEASFPAWLKSLLTSQVHYISIFTWRSQHRPHQDAGGAGGEESHPQHPGGDQEGPRQGEGAAGGPQHPEAASTNCKYINI